MPQTSVCPQIHQSLYVHGYFAPEIPLDLILLIDNPPDTGNLPLGQFIGFGIPIYTGLAEYPLRRTSAKTIDIGQSNLNPFPSW